MTEQANNHVTFIGADGSHMADMIDEGFSSWASLTGFVNDEPQVVMVSTNSYRDLRAVRENSSGVDLLLMLGDSRRALNVSDAMAATGLPVLEFTDNVVVKMNRLDDAGLWDSGRVNNDEVGEMFRRLAWRLVNKK